jgi:regulator of RNase E activity RraA
MKLIKLSTTRDVMVVRSILFSMSGCKWGEAMESTSVHSNGIVLLSYRLIGLLSDTSAQLEFTCSFFLEIGMQWTSDRELFNVMRNKLFTAVIGDVLDVMGLQHQFLPPEVRPLGPKMRLVGRAMPVLEADFFDAVSPTGNSPLSKQQFGLMFRALDSLKENDIYFASGSSPRYALWGELMSTRAMKLGAAGAVVNGYSRDTEGVLALNFPCFSYGSYAQDQGPRGKVVDFGVPVELGGVRVNPGDIVFGDRDGVVIVPKAAEDEAVRLALEKVEKENTVRKAIEAGMSTVEAFEKFGVM